MSLPPPDSSPEFDRLLGEYQRRLRAGDGPSADAYADRYPHLADRIREVFPVVAALELAATPAPSTHPRLLGDYRIIREVGRGGMGVVYEAVQESLGRRVAVKVFPVAHLRRPGLLERFQREAQAAGRLHHTNIVPVFGVGDQDGVPFFAMQFISGTGLDRVLAAVRRDRAPADLTQAGQADPTTPVVLAAATTPSPARPSVLVGQAGAAYFRTAARLMLEAADALAHAHAHGVQHRDIKPSNLIVDDEGTLWVTDFGLAKLDDGSNLTATGDQLGTLRYAPPERFRGTADTRADVYSLGATFYEVLALRHAFPATDPLAVVDQIKAAAPPPPRAINPAVPRDLDTICLKCLEKDPGRRYQTADLLAADLRAYLDGRPITARRVGPVEATVKWAKRRPVAATALGAALLLAVVMGAGAELRERERQADRAAFRVMVLQRADLGELAPMLDEIRGSLDRARPMVVAMAERPITQRAGLNARLALVGDDPRYADEIADHLLTAPAEQLLPVRQIAGPHLSRHRQRFWAILSDPAAHPVTRLRAAGLLAGQMPDEPQWAAVARQLVDLLVSNDPVELGQLTRALAPVLPRLVDGLQDRYEQDRRELATPGFAAPAELAARVGRMNAAAVLLWQTLEERPEAVAWLAGVAEDAHLPAPLAAIRRRPPLFESMLRAVLADPSDDPEAARRRAGAAAALLAGAGPDDPAWALFRHTGDPTTRSHLIRRCAPSGVPAAALVRRLRAEADASARRGLLLALGDYPPDRLPADFLPAVRDLYRADPDPGLHAAAGWALRHRWGRAADVDRIDRAPTLADRAGRAWFVSPLAGTFAAVPPPGRTRIGTPGHAADPRLSDEAPAEVDINRRFAIGLTEVTAEQFCQWPDRPPEVDVGHGETAAGRVSWYMAAEFCNWLSEQEGLEPCYLPNADGKFAAGMRPVPFHTLRTGYRLPTEAEWEYAARAGAGGPRFFGRADDLLTRYAWTVSNSGDQAHPVGALRPNDLGLFDVLGNVQEWAVDTYTDTYPPGPRPDFGLYGPVQAGDNHVLRGGAYNLPENRLRPAYRFNIIARNNPASCGFRLARTLK